MSHIPTGLPATDPTDPTEFGCTVEWAEGGRFVFYGFALPLIRRGEPVAVLHAADGVNVNQKFVVPKAQYLNLFRRV